MVTGDFPTTNAEAGLDSTPTNIKGTYVASVEVGDGGKITATFGDDAHTELKDHELFLTPGGLDSGSITWACTGEEDIKAYLPSGCEVASAAVGKGTPWAEIVDAGLQEDYDACWNDAKKQWEAGENSYTGDQAVLRHVAHFGHSGTYCAFMAIAELECHPVFVLDANGVRRLIEGCK